MLPSARQSCVPQLPQLPQLKPRTRHHTPAPVKGCGFFIACMCWEGFLNNKNCVPGACRVPQRACTLCASCLPALCLHPAPAPCACLPGACTLPVLPAGCRCRCRRRAGRMRKAGILPAGCRRLSGAKGAAGTGCLHWEGFPVHRFYPRFYSPAPAPGRAPV